ncbi:MAG: hypothetical protein FWD69_03450 [Polyangiaceae bacterium]|nr:hypothetical protein [Polyangiaceae bacterium]
MNEERKRLPTWKAIIVGVLAVIFGLSVWVFFASIYDFLEGPRTDVGAIMAGIDMVVAVVAGVVGMSAAAFMYAIVHRKDYSGTHLR